MIKKQIKALIFDVGGVLQLGKYSTKPVNSHRLIGVHKTISKKLHVSLDQYFDAIDTVYAKSIEGKMSEARVLSIMAKKLKTTTKKLTSLFIKTYKKNFQFNKQLFRLIISLKKKGYKIAILSDQWYLSKKALMPKKYTKKFDVEVTSCDVGLRKPDPKMYRLILKKLKLPAKQTLFIDNQEWNIKPAKKFGMNTILFKNNKQLFKQLSKQGIDA
jgi:epoxide hydrolase-like predicted phosphatase